MAYMAERKPIGMHGGAETNWHVWRSGNQLACVTEQNPQNQETGFYIETMTISKIVVILTENQKNSNPANSPMFRPKATAQRIKYNNFLVRLSLKFI